MALVEPLAVSVLSSGTYDRFARFLAKVKEQLEQIRVPIHRISPCFGQLFMYPDLPLINRRIDLRGTNAWPGRAKSPCPQSPGQALTPYPRLH